jgi:DNA repair exonuclease SbcCD ATPase subunit
MIPRRVKLGGFLSYKDEQEVSFNDSPLWMLSGLNGSGKSSIFDALTFALFNSHRGGSRDGAELINKDSKSLSVEFDFLVDGQEYRIHRTLRRDARGGVKSTHNVYSLERGTGKPSPILDAHSSDGFKKWVSQKIGLDYKTFTSSVLLLQGRAEKLLDGNPKDRSEVLAGIVDLERYQTLHEKADANRKTIKSKLEAIDGQISGVPDVTDFEMLAAENRIVDAERMKETAAKNVERLQNLEFEARKWADIQTRLGGLNARWQKAESLIGESTTIEIAYRRLRELKDVIPHLLIIQEKQRSLDESTRASSQFLLLKDQSDAQAAQLRDAQEVSRKKKKSHQVALMQEEQKLEQTRARLQELAGPLSQLGLYEEQTSRLKQVDGELARLPRDLAEQVQRAQQAFDRRLELGKVAPLLDRFASARLSLREATRRSGDLHKAEKETREAGESARQRHLEAKTVLDRCALDRLKSDEATTEARTVFQHAKAALSEFKNLDNAKLCRACGQVLTPGHWEAEKAKREQDLDAAVAIHAKAVAAQKTAIAAETDARRHFESADQELQRLRDAYRDTTRDASRTREEVERLLDEIRLAYQHLPTEQRESISPTPPVDWLATSWPNADELHALKAEAGELDSARSNVQQIQQKLATYDRLLANRNAAQSTLDSMKSVLANSDPVKLRKEEAKLKAEEEAYAGKVRGTKKLIQETDLELERLARDIADAQKTLSGIDSQLSVEAANRVQHQDAIDRASKLLPPAWREAATKAGLAEQNRWKAELETLTKQGTESRYQELERTRASIESLKQDIAAAKQEETAIAEEARKPVEEVKSLLAAARQQVVGRSDELQAAREEKAILDRHRTDRERLRLQKLALDKDLTQATMLAQLLGRDRLQRHLVRTAEKQIIDYANGILDRLSSGQLFLRLCGGEEGVGADRALELEAYNRMTGSTPINVNFLSGSQRFRVAVSLALGIGQYASRQHRPIESVIIDEGFGCLDRNGRQVMIQELQNLRGHLKCILLVSHQEEFADAFADGYRFELVDGATRVTRFQR